MTASKGRTRARAGASVRQGLVLWLMCGAMAMVGLDTAIVNVALPSMQRELGISQSSLQWVVVAYGLLLGGFLLLGGRVADQLGRRRVFLAGLVVFTGASFAAGIAEGLGMLIVARSVQGLGAAFTVPAALSLLAITFAEGRERDRAIGIFGAVGGAAGSVGVVAGGLLAGGPGWRWAFYINVPAGLLMIILTVVVLAPDVDETKGSELDVSGATTVTGGLLVLVYAMHQATERGWLAGSTLLLFLTAAVLLAGFVWIEAHSKSPLIRASSLSGRTLITSNLTAFLLSASFLAFIFVGSLLMQQVVGYSPARAGVSWLATTLTTFLASMVSSRQVARFGLRRVLALGALTLAAGALWVTRVPPEAAGYAIDLLPAFLLAGLGFGTCVPALQIGALTGVAGSDTGLAAGLVETLREVGGATGAAVVTTAFIAWPGLMGFHAAFVIIGALALVGAAVAMLGIHRPPANPMQHRINQ